MSSLDRTSVLSVTFKQRCRYLSIYKCRLDYVSACTVVCCHWGVMFVLQYYQEMFSISSSQCNRLSGVHVVCMYVAAYVQLVSTLRTYIRQLLNFNSCTDQALILLQCMCVLYCMVARYMHIIIYVYLVLHTACAQNVHVLHPSAVSLAGAMMSPLVTSSISL